jgi:hypothetical protein
VGTVYLAHLEPGLPVTADRVARHSLGYADGEVSDRIAQHCAGRGSPLIAAVIRAGGTVTVERTWPNVDRSFERALKRRKETPRLCPRCVGAGHTGSRGLLLAEHMPAAAPAPRAASASR